MISGCGFSISAIRSGVWDIPSMGVKPCQICISAKPKRGDHTEEYQAVYHEYMLKCFERNPYLWATHVWNMFDFAADARDQGGEPGMNHKGLITFDRRTKKDSFYLYKAYWSPEPFVHIAGKRRKDREEALRQ